MKLSVVQTEKLKEIQMEMFNIFISICQEQKLSYFALGGTSLGAIRHNGYIP